MSKNLVFKSGRVQGALSTVLLGLLTACGGGDGEDIGNVINSATTASLISRGRDTLELEVSVDAADPHGRRLHYQWRATDGSIEDVDSPTTTWKVTDGPGLHFAYVLVSNGAGGYIERRAALNTDQIGTPIMARTPERYRAPPAAIPVGEVYRSFVRSGAQAPGILTSLPNVAHIPYKVRDASGTIQFPATGVAVSDIRGQLVISGMLPVATATPLQMLCKYDTLGSFVNCGDFNFDFGTDFTVRENVAVTDYYVRSQAGGQPATPVVGGQVHLADGSPCGMVNEFFGLETTGSATLVDNRGRVLRRPVTLSADGTYLLPYLPNAAAVVLRCEKAIPVRISIAGAGGLPDANFTATGQPNISDMTVTLNGATVGGLLPPPTDFPSDVAPDPERFLSYKGIDSLKDACDYYKAIGAARGCDSDGNLINPINFDDWMRTVKIGKYAVAGAPEFSAKYINKADLNLARNHHAINYDAQHSAAYVCNHLGPKVLDPDQTEIDSVIDNLVQGKNLVACVAMDYSPSPGVNGGAAFVRFLTFGPNGQLLPSVNLDGRREKFVPGTCVACHGGDHYAGHFSADGRADVGAHFLPYDPGNFEFSSKRGLTEADQEAQIYELNQVVLKTNATAAATELINGWYESGKTVNKNYLPPSWRGRDQLSTDFYREVVAKSCRGCHVNLKSYNFDEYDHMTTTPYREVGPDFSYTIGCEGANAKYRSHSMPNSLVTFNRFWNSAGTAVDQPALLNAFSAQATGGDPAVLNCIP